MSGFGGVTRGVAVVNVSSSASESDAEDASPSGSGGSSRGGRSKKEALRIAGEAYFDRVLSEAGGKAGLGASKMSSAAGGAGGKSGGGAGVSTGYALGLGESANRKGGSSHKGIGKSDEPIMNDEDQAALDAIEQTIERSKAFLLIFIHVAASGLSLICITHAMPMTKSTWSTVFIHLMSNVIAVGLASSIGVLNPEEELNFDLQRLRAAIIPGSLHVTMTYTLYKWFRRNHETYAMALWCGISMWIPYIIKVVLIGDVPKNEPTSYIEYREYLENGDEDPLLAGAEEAGKIDPPNDAKSGSSAAMRMENAHVPSSGKNYAHYILAFTLGVVIRRPYLAPFLESWALRVVTAAFFGMWAENRALGKISEPKLFGRVFTFIGVYSLQCFCYQYSEMMKDRGRPILITRLIEGKKSVILNDAEKIFYCCLLGIPLSVASAYYLDYAKFYFQEVSVPVVQMHVMLLGCVVAANVTYLVAKPLVSKEVWAPVMGLTGLFALITYYYTLADGREFLIALMMLPMFVAWGYLIEHDKRSFYPGRSIIGV